MTALRRRWSTVSKSWRTMLSDETGDVPGWVLVTLVTGV